MGLGSIIGLSRIEFRCDNRIKHFFGKVSFEHHVCRLAQIKPKFSLETSQLNLKTQVSNKK